MTTARPVLLVIDDEKGIRDLVGTTFEEDYEVLATDSAEEAFGLIEAKRPAVILLDIRLPGIDGIEALRRIKQQHTDTVVVMITAFGDEKSALRCMRLGAAAYLHKPFDVNYLSMLVQNYVH